MIQLAEDASDYLITQCGSKHEIRQALQANIVGDFRIGLKFSTVSGQNSKTQCK